MRELRGNLWDLPGDARCITTNGAVTRAGRAVMGRGCALEAKTRYPGFDEKLARRLKDKGNHVGWTTMPDGLILIVFPVKHLWNQKADITLIERSAHELMFILNRHPEWETVLLPRPGCGNGHLDWDDVRLVLEPILDDRVAIVTF